MSATAMGEPAAAGAPAKRKRRRGSDGPIAQRGRSVLTRDERESQRKILRDVFASPAVQGASVAEARAAAGRLLGAGALSSASFDEAARVLERAEPRMNAEGRSTARDLLAADLLLQSEVDVFLVREFSEGLARGRARSTSDTMRAAARLLVQHAGATMTSEQLDDEVDALVAMVFEPEAADGDTSYGVTRYVQIPISVTYWSKVKPVVVAVTESKPVEEPLPDGEVAAGSPTTTAPVPEGPLPVDDQPSPSARRSVGRSLAIAGGTAMGAGAVMAAVWVPIAQAQRCDFLEDAGAIPLNAKCSGTTPLFPNTPAGEQNLDAYQDYVRDVRLSIGVSASVATIGAVLLIAGIVKLKKEQRASASQARIRQTFKPGGVGFAF